MGSVQRLSAVCATWCTLGWASLCLADGPVLEERAWLAEVDGNEAEIRIVERWLIADRQAERQLDDLVFSENRFRDLKDVTVTVRDSTGRVLAEKSKKDLEKHCGFGAGYQAYSDICYYTYSPVGQPFPYVIESVADIKLKSLFFLRGTRLVPIAHPFGQCRVELRLKEPSQAAFRVRGMAVEPQIENQDDWTIYSWAVSGEDSLTVDQTDFAGYLEMTVQPLEFGGYEIDSLSWTEIGNWYADLASERYNLEGDAPATITAAEAIGRAVAAELDSVRHRCRYVSISLGVGGWRPSPARSTLARGYGDCKDLSTALIDLLRLRGVRALPVLVLTRGEGVIDSTFPEFGFNHVITAVPREHDTLWVDPTCRVCPPGDLPLMDEDLLSLLVDEAGGQLVRTPASKPQDNQRSLHADVTLLPDMSFTASGFCTITGNEAHRLKYRFSGEAVEAQRQLLQELLESSGSRLEVESFAVSGLDEVASPLHISFTVRSLKPLRSIRGKTYLTSDFLVLGSASASQLAYPNVAVDSFIIDVGQQTAADSIVLPPGVDTVIYSDYVRIAAHRKGERLTLVKRETYTGYLEARREAWGSADPPRDLRRGTSYVVTLSAR